MNRILASALSLLVSGCSAQDLRAPVNVAFKLYSDCLHADSFVADVDLTRAGIDEYVHAVDLNCRMWLVVWYPPLMGHELTSWTTDKLERFSKLRFEALDRITNVLEAEAGLPLSPPAPLPKIPSKSKPAGS